MFTKDYESNTLKNLVYNHAFSLRDGPPLAVTVQIVPLSFALCLLCWF